MIPVTYERHQISMFNQIPDPVTFPKISIGVPSISISNLTEETGPEVVEQWLEVNNMSGQTNKRAEMPAVQNQKDTHQRKPDSVADHKHHNDAEKSHRATKGSGGSLILPSSVTYRRRSSFLDSTKSEQVLYENEHV